MLFGCTQGDRLTVSVRTPYGREYEVVAQTFLDSHKAERDVNHWLLVTSDPAGEGLTLLERPQTQTLATDLQQADTVS